MDWKEFENETTEDLLEMIKWRNDSEEYATAENAFKAFFFRFRDDVTKKARVVARNWGYDKDVGDAIAENAFDRFWRKPFTFNASKCKTLDIDRCIRLYLYKIARNLLADHKRLEESGPGPYSGDEELVMEFPDLERMALTNEKLRDLKKLYELIKGAIDRLSPKHKVIYLTYHAYEKEGLKLPRKLLQTLRDELDLTQSTIRVYKKEAFDTVEQYMKVYGSK